MTLSELLCKVSEHVDMRSGDFTMSGSEAETLDFLEWLCDLPYRHKVLVAGNHDACLYGARMDGLDDNVHYLCGSGVEIEGLKFWGVLMFMEDCVSGHQEQLYAAIPDDTDVLVTHALDLHTEHRISVLRVLVCDPFNYTTDLCHDGV